MQIRLARDLEGRVRVAPGPITVEEFIARFPEVPRDLRDEPVIAEFVRAFGSQLRVAQKPSPCVARASTLRQESKNDLIDMCRSNRHYGHKKAGSSEAAIKDRRSAGRLRAFLVIRHNAAMSSSTLSGRPLASVALK